MASNASSRAANRRQQGGARRMPGRVGFLVAITVVVAIAWLHQSHAAEGPGFFFFWGSEARNAVKTVEADFPGALPGPDAAVRMLKAVQPFGLRRKNVAFGQSIVSDGISGDRGHVSTIFTQPHRAHAATLLKRFFGGSFFLGGLGGAPSDGKAGFGTFTRTTTGGDHVLVIYGAHVSFSAVAAQQSMAKVFAMNTYRAVEEEVLNMVHTNFGEGYLVLIGGIQINMPYPLAGYWVPMHFSVRSKTTSPKDLMAAFS